jgi:hypothetical protein
MDTEAQKLGELFLVRSHNNRLDSIGLLALTKALVVHNHQGQFRRNGEPFANHVLRVGDKHAHDLERQIAGRCHDMGEDCDIQLSDLREFGIPECSIQTVEILTKRKGAGFHDARGQPTGPNWKEPYFDYIVRIGASPGKAGRDAVFLKIDDNDDNIKSDENGGYELQDNHKLKLQAYRISKAYLEAIRDEKIPQGTLMLTFMSDYLPPQNRDQNMKLIVMPKFSSEITYRNETPRAELRVA